jgi:spore coat protein H
VRADGQVLDKVGVHLKGRGSFRPLEEKPGLTLDFGRYLPAQRFHGLRKIHLNNSVEDPSFVKEWIGSELFRAAGVPAPLVSHALVKLNGRPLGLYVLKEGFAEEFFVRSFLRADGYWYDVDDGHDVDQPMNRRLVGEFWQNVDDLQRLALAVREPDRNERWTRLHESLDVDRFITFMAMEVMICHWDGYCLARNNFRIYQPTNRPTMFLPAGMDQLFANPLLSWQPQMAGLVAKAILDMPEGREQYSATFRKLFGEHFAVAHITNQINQLQARLRPFLSAHEFAQIREEAAELSVRILEREHYLERELNQPPIALLDVPRHGAPLGGWRPVDSPRNGTMREDLTLDWPAALHIVAGPATAGSWRTTVRLRHGRYGFEGLARVRNVAPLPFGKNQGARLRVAGVACDNPGLIGTTGWERLHGEFEVRDAEAEIELVCELRADGGEVWFAKDSLAVTLKE